MPSIIFGQCKVSIKISDTCDDCNNLLSYEITLSDGIYNYSSPSGINILNKGFAHAWINVNRCDKYKLLYFDFDVPDEEELYINITIPKLIIMSDFNGINPNVDHRYYYWCKELANGGHVDYYENGNMRMDGVFDEGQPIGKLHSYLENGNINFIAKYSKKGKFRKLIVFFYDRNGDLFKKVRYKTDPESTDLLYPDRGAYGGFIGFKPEFSVK